MNKKEIVKKMAEKLDDKSIKEINDMIDALTASIINGVNEKNRVAMSGFAIFEKIKKPASSGEINGHKWEKDEHFAVKIKPLKKLKEAIQNDRNSICTGTQK